MIFTKNTMEEHDEIEIRSDEVQEIIGTTPGWILRWGSTAALLVLFLLGLLSWFIHYPDTIEAPVVVRTTNSAVPVIAPKSGILMKIIKKEQEIVAAGQVLGIMDNSARYEDVVTFEDRINMLRDTDNDLLLTFTFENDLELGELEPKLIELSQDFEDLKFLSKGNKNQAEIASINQRIKATEKSVSIKEAQRDNLKSRIQKMKTIFEDQREQYIDKPKTISNETLRNSYADIKSMGLSLENIEADLKASRVKSEADIIDLKRKKIALQDDSNVDLTDNFEALKTKMFNVQKAIDNWKRKNLIMASQDGRITIYTKDNRRNNIKIKNGQTIMGIFPIEGSEGNLLAEVELPIEGAGRVNAGQKVYIKLAKYPYQEFGIIKGVVEKIGILPRGENYIVKVTLPDGLNTNRHKELSFTHEMKGRAEIITDDKRLIERIFEKLIQIVN